VYATVPGLSRSAVCASVLVVAGCASAETSRHHHHRFPEPDESAAPADPPLGPWSDFPRLHDFVPVTDVPHSAHILGEDAGHISRSPEALADLRASQPAGAVIAESLASDPDAPLESYFVMRKLAAGANPAGGDWEYLVVKPDGSMSAQGKLPLCQRCHAEAGPSFVFSPG
jgi:hypothetical protein